MMIFNRLVPLTGCRNRWNYGISAHDTVTEDDMENKIILRELQPSEYPLIKDFTFISMFSPPDEEPYGIEFLDHPVVTPYHVNFGKNDGDYAIAAEIDGKIGGISWTRIFPLHDYDVNDLPVLCMAVLPEYRRMGLGRQTLIKLHELLIGGSLAVSYLKDTTGRGRIKHEFCTIFALFHTFFPFGHKKNPRQFEGLEVVCFCLD